MNFLAERIGGCFRPPLVKGESLKCINAAHDLRQVAWTELAGSAGAVGELGEADGFHGTSYNRPRLARWDLAFCDQLQPFHPVEMTAVSSGQWEAVTKADPRQQVLRLRGAPSFLGVPYPGAHFRFLPCVDGPL